MLIFHSLVNEFSDGAGVVGLGQTLGGGVGSGCLLLQFHGAKYRIEMRDGEECETQLNREINRIFISMRSTD